MPKVAFIHRKCTCDCECWFIFFTIISLLSGVTELTIGGIIHTIRFHRAVTDEWFTEFFAVTCGVLNIVICVYGICINYSTDNLQKKFQEYGYILLVPIAYEGFSCLMFSLPILYRGIDVPLPAHIPSSQFQRPTYERIIYIRVMIIIIIVSLFNFFFNMLYWCFTICYAKSNELENRELSYAQTRNLKDRGKFAKQFPTRPK